MSSLVGIRFPGRYIQGAGALGQLADLAHGFGASAFAVIDPAVAELFHDRIPEQFAQQSLVLESARHSGECSDLEVKRLGAELAKGRHAMVIGVGGGKALDTAKLVAHQNSLPVIVVPTIAASDAPCSALSVVYTEDGEVDRDVFLPRNPDLVLVDTEVIAQAPSRFLSAGIGDALATWFEASSCQRSGAANCMGLPGAPLAYHIAAQCHATLMEFGAKSVEAAERGQVTDALERVVEANTLLSGIGFESGGVATAHAIHHGLCELDDVHGALHGEKVAIGILAGLIIQGRLKEVQEITSFYRSVKLPTRLQDIGIVDVTDQKLKVVAKRSCRPGEIIHNEPTPVSEEQVVSALLQLGS